MDITKILTSIVALGILCACSHPLEIRGEGDVRSSSGNRNCLLEEFRSGSDNCRKNIVVTDYLETYTAEPRDGWQFSRWLNYCGDATDNTCSFNVPADAVKKNWGQTLPPLIAVFTRTKAEVRKEILADITGKDVYRDAAGKGYAYVCPGAASSRSFLITVPGFDPDRVDSKPDDAEFSEACKEHSDKTNHHLISIRWSNGADYLQRNAGVLRAAIQRIKGKYAISGADKVALVGVSMGGVVSRYALLHMENEGVAHGVDLFVTVDSPHTGAYVPIGIQHIANVFEDKGGKATLNRVNTPAARQMLRYHYTRGTNQQTYTDDYVNLYRDELEALGGYPRAEGMRRVAVASGRGDGVLQQPRGGAEYLRANRLIGSQTVIQPFGFSIFKGKLTYQIKLHAKVNAWALDTNAPGRSSRVAKIDVDASIDGVSFSDTTKLAAFFKKEAASTLGISQKLIPNFVVKLISDAADKAVSSATRTFAGQYADRNFSVPRDGRTSAGVPGGLSNAIWQVRVQLEGAEFEVRDLKTPGENTFIPTASALGLGSAIAGSGVISPDTNLLRGDWEAASPFDKIYLEDDNNLGHTTSNAGWEQELKVLFASSQ